MKFTSAVLSKPGNSPFNTDSCGCLEESLSPSCWVLADGRSHSNLGNRISSAAINGVLNTFKRNPAITPEIALKLLESAQHEVSVLSSQLHNPQASIALLCSGGRSALWAHSGNVRLYVLRDGRILYQTQDHSATQSQLEAGHLQACEFNSHPDRRVLNRYLGCTPMPMPTIIKERFLIQPEDCFLICSDGFWEKLSEDEILIDWCKSGHPRIWLDHLEMRIQLQQTEELDSYSAIALQVEP